MMCLQIKSYDLKCYAHVTTLEKYILSKCLQVLLDNLQALTKNNGPIYT